MPDAGLGTGQIRLAESEFFAMPGRVTQSRSTSTRNANATVGAMPLLGAMHALAGFSERSVSGKGKQLLSLRRRLLGFCLLGAVSFLSGCVPYTPSTVNYPADWNRKGIEWRPYGLGIRDARKLNRPIVLVFYTDWCPHCHNYSRVFHDPRLVAASKGFIMIRVERDGNRELSRQYDLDGDYIPRTLFLRPDGTVLGQLDADRSEYRYFLDEFEADQTLELMGRATSLVAAPVSAAKVEPD